MAELKPRSTYRECSCLGVLKTAQKEVYQGDNSGRLGVMGDFLHTLPYSSRFYDTHAFF